MVDNLAVISAVWIFRSNAIKGLHPATFQGIKGPSNKCPHHFLPVCVSLIFRGNIADGDDMCVCVSECTCGIDTRKGVMQW